MSAAFELVPSAAGLALAGAAVVAGAPLFSGGLRALRLTRALSGLRESPLDRAESGVAHVRGTVRLESPLFSPLAGAPCAGFRLEISGGQGAVSRAFEDFRPFRLAAGDATVRVLADGVRCVLAETARREVRADAPLSENLAALIAQVPEAEWLRRCGGTLTLTERVLAAGGECHVIGVLEPRAEIAPAVEPELLATGTDDVAVVAHAGAPSDDDAIAVIAAGEPFGPVLVSDRAPELARLRGPALGLAGLVLGPALSLAGLVVLARLADQLRSHAGY